MDDEKDVIKDDSGISKLNQDEIAELLATVPHDDSNAVDTRDLNMNSSTKGFGSSELSDDEINALFSNILDSPGSSSIQEFSNEDITVVSSFGEDLNVDGSGEDFDSGLLNDDEIAALLSQTDAPIQKEPEALNEDIFAAEQDPLDVSTIPLDHEEIAELLERVSPDEYDEYNNADFVIDDSNLNYDFDVPDEYDSLPDMSAISDEDLQFVQDVSVYDTIERDDPFDEVVRASKKMASELGDGQGITIKTLGVIEDEQEKDIKKAAAVVELIQNPKIITVLAVVIVVIIASIGGLGYIIKQSADKKAQLKNIDIRDANIVSVPRYVSNSSNYIYLTSQPVLFEQDVMELNKMVANKEETVFNFKQKINWNKYDIGLTDDEEYNYMQKLIMKDEDYYSDSVYFEPLNPRVKGVVLSITEKDTGFEMKFPYQFEKSLPTISSSYITKPRTLHEEEEMSIKLLSGVFSTTASNITYAINHESTDGLVFDAIYLSVGNKKFFLDKTPSLTYTRGENTTVTNVNFSPLDFLNSKVDINFTDGYKIYNYNSIIDHSRLFLNTPQNEIQIECGKNKIILERMGRMGEKYVIVAHAENEEGIRIKARYDITIDVTDEDGTTHTLTGVNRSSVVGADILFDLKQIEGLVPEENLPDSNSENSDETKEEVKISSLKFTVNNVKLDHIYISTEDIISSVDLSVVSTKRETKDITTLEQSAIFFESKGATQIENRFFYWEGRTFYGLFGIVDEAGQMKNYLLTGTQNGKDIKFSRRLIKNLNE